MLHDALSVFAAPEDLWLAGNSKCSCNGFLIFINPSGVNGACINTQHKNAFGRAVSLYNLEYGLSDDDITCSITMFSISLAIDVGAMIDDFLNIPDIVLNKLKMTSRMGLGAVHCNVSRTRTLSLS